MDDAGSTSAWLLEGQALIRQLSFGQWALVIGGLIIFGLCVWLWIAKRRLSALPDEVNPFVALVDFVSQSLFRRKLSDWLTYLHSPALRCATLTSNYYDRLVDGHLAECWGDTDPQHARTSVEAVLSGVTSAFLTREEIFRLECDLQIINRKFFSRLDIPEEYLHREDLVERLRCFYKSLLADRENLEALLNVTASSDKVLALQQSREQRERLRSKIAFSDAHRKKTVPKAQSTIDSLLFYTERGDDFVGRESLIERLVDEFLDIDPVRDDALFRWTVVSGEAGVGKSRFALEMLAQSERQLFGDYEPRYWGFVEARSAKKGTLIAEGDIEEWYLDEPAFMVIDYAAIQENLADVVKGLHDKAIESGQPIRLMLLERSNTAGGLRELQRFGASMNQLADARYDLSLGGEQEGMGILLPPLPDEDVVEIIKRRANNETVTAADAGWLLECLNSLTRPGEGVQERRPLFAAMVGYALSLCSTSAEASTAFGMPRIDNRDTLIRMLIDNDRQSYWFSENGLSDTERERDRYENLLALSTFTRGLTIDHLQPLEDVRQLVFPSFQGFDEKRFQMMASNRQEKGQIGFLEPDFIGELFVLDHISQLTPARRERFLNLAWELGKKQAVEFARRCHLDHPDRVMSEGYLLPSDMTQVDLIVLLLRNIMLDWRGSLFVLKQQELDRNIDKIRMVEHRADEVFKLLRARVDVCETNELDDSARALIADATESYLFIKAWFLSPGFRAGPDRRIRDQHRTDFKVSPVTLVNNSDDLRKTLADQASVFNRSSKQREQVPGQKLERGAGQMTRRE